MTTNDYAFDQSRTNVFFVVFFFGEICEVAFAIYGQSGARWMCDKPWKKTLETSSVQVLKMRTRPGQWSGLACTCCICICCPLLLLLPLYAGSNGSCLWLPLPHFNVFGDQVLMPQQQQQQAQPVHSLLWYSYHVYHIERAGPGSDCTLQSLISA